MKNKYPEIVFYGTPEFAVKSLNILMENGYHVAAVVTPPDKPSGRGLKMKQSAVKQFALEHKLKVFQPEKLSSDKFLSALNKINPGLQIVVAFRKLPQSIWSLAPTFNLHASLLPDYRGAAPINWAVINGEKKTGVTTFFINEKIDTGDIILQKEVAIENNDTAGSLHDKLAEAGALLVLSTVRDIIEKKINLIRQPEGIIPKPAPKLSKELCRIDWNSKASELYNFIRGLSPYPAAWTTLNGKVFKIFSCKITLAEHQQLPGTIDTDKKTFLKIFVKDGILEPTLIQPESKKRMSTGDFLRGWNFSNSIIIQ